MPETKTAKERYDLGMRMRAQVQGPNHPALDPSKLSGLPAAFHAHVTNAAWADCWADERMSVRDRTFITLGMIAAQGRAEEFEGHVRNGLRNGITPAELEAFAIHAAVYCGLPAGNMCMRVIHNVLNPPKKA